jgi:diacylglycerol kinase (ATP)
MKSNYTGLKRVIAAAGYSLEGICFAWRREAAFRQGLLLMAVLVGMALSVGFDPLTRLFLVVLAFLIPLAEIINSAIEAVVDLVSPEAHDLAKAAKDMGSAAVFIALLMNAVAWVLSLAPG